MSPERSNPARDSKVQRIEEGDSEMNIGEVVATGSENPNIDVPIQTVDILPNEPPDPEHVNPTSSGSSDMSNTPGDSTDEQSAVDAETNVASLSEEIDVLMSSSRSEVESNLNIVDGLTEPVDAPSIIAHESIQVAHEEPEHVMEVHIASGDAVSATIDESTISSTVTPTAITESRIEAIDHSSGTDPATTQRPAENATTTTTSSSTTTATTTTTSRPPTTSTTTPSVTTTTTERATTLTTTVSIQPSSTSPAPTTNSLVTETHPYAVSETLSAVAADDVMIVPDGLGIFEIRQPSMDDLQSRPVVILSTSIIGLFVLWILSRLKAGNRRYSQGPRCCCAKLASSRKPTSSIISGGPQVTQLDPNAVQAIRHQIHMIHTELVRLKNERDAVDNELIETSTQILQSLGDQINRVGSPDVDDAPVSSSQVIRDLTYDDMQNTQRVLPPVSEQPPPVVHKPIPQTAVEHVASSKSPVEAPKAPVLAAKPSAPASAVPKMSAIAAARMKREAESVTESAAKAQPATVGNPFGAPQPAKGPFGR